MIHSLFSRSIRMSIVITLKLNSHLMRHDAARRVTVRQKRMWCVHI